MKWCMPSHVLGLLSSPHSRFLLSSGAFPAQVNNDGDTPVDLAENENISDMIKEQIDKLGVYGVVCV